MTSQSQSLAPHVQAFFTHHLCQHKQASPQTIASYRDTFRLFFTFVQATTGREPAALQVRDLDAPSCCNFSTTLSTNAGTRSARAICAWPPSGPFSASSRRRAPESLAIVTRVLAIPTKRADKKLIGALTRAAVEALLAAPDRSYWVGRRDHALLLTLYNSGARVSEVTTLQRHQVCFGPSTLLQLTGKGRKERTVPLWPHTSRTRQAWFAEFREDDGQTAFPNTRGHPLSRDGVAHLLQRATHNAVTGCPSLRTKKVTPHVLRHTTALHLLQAGVDIAVIALWLGHESIEITHVYLEIDLAHKEQALHKLAPVEGPMARFTTPDPLLAFLTFPLIMARCTRSNVRRCFLCALYAA